MFKIAVDENFRGAILRGILRQRPDWDIVRIQDTPGHQKPDREVLAWCAAEGRVLFTHDLRTMPRFASERIRAGLSMPGLVEVSDRIPVGVAIDEIIMLIECSHDYEWPDQIRYISPS